MTDLEHELRNRIASGGHAFVPYVTGGLLGVDAGLLQELAGAGADAIEVGIPFSDPVMDGPVVQEASKRALDAGATPERVMAVVADASVGAPVVLMTYLNPVLAAGFDRFLGMAREAGVAGVIVPDLPVDEADEWASACEGAGVASVLLAAPGTSTERLQRIATTSRGFVYCVSTYGVTGGRQALAGTAKELVEALRPFTRTPLLVGVGIGTPDAARAACVFADGIVVGSALVRPLLDGDRRAALTLAKEFRAAIT
ncbi:MAG: tryptophan synthase subunit alpha [Actinomycetota bacterium]